MRKIKHKERQLAGHIYCPYCKPSKVDAVWRIDGFSDKSKDVACDTHKDKIVDLNNDEHLTEADYQTWNR